MPDDNKVSQNFGNVKPSRVALREDATRYGGEGRGREDEEKKDQSNSYSSLQMGGVGRGGEKSAHEHLVALGFEDPSAQVVLERYGATRVLWAVGYVRSRRNVRNPAAYVRWLLQSGLPIPLPIAQPKERRLSGKYHDKVQH